MMRVCGHSFVKDLLGETPVVLDCGANHGAFSGELARNHRARVYGFEPDPRLFPRLPNVANVSFFNLAVSGTEGDLILNLGEGNCSSARFSEGAGQTSVTVGATTLDAFCNEKALRAIDLLKVDIEGAEIDVLERLPQGFLAATGQITVEFHDFLDASELPRIRRVIRRMRESGFYFIRFSYHDYSDCLFVNTGLHPLGARRKAGLLWEKYYRGVMRKLNGFRGIATSGGGK